MGELSSFVKEYADALAKATGHITCIADKDQVIAVAGGPKKEFIDKSISSNLEKIIQGRSIFKATKDDTKFVPILTRVYSTSRCKTPQIYIIIVNNILWIWLK